MRCPYCGETSWRPFRRIANGEFCSREHRKSYHERLRKIASELVECQSAPAKATYPGASAVVETSSAQLEPNAAVCGQLLPIEISGMLAAASDYERMALANGDPAETLLQADVHPVGLRSQSLLPLWINDDQAGVDTWQPLPVVSAAGRAVPVGFVSGMLPAGFENRAQIKRWGLKIKFPKV
jgi:hypothetical protein